MELFSRVQAHIRQFELIPPGEK
jgi:hypothetical protein